MELRGDATSWRRAAREHRVFIAQRREPRKQCSRVKNNLPQFKTGDKIFIRRYCSRTQFQIKWNGPFEIIKEAGPTVYWVYKPNGPPTK